MRTPIDGFSALSGLNSSNGAVFVPAAAMAAAKDRKEKEAFEEARVEDQGQKTEPPGKTVTADTLGSEESRRGTGEPPTSPPTETNSNDGPGDEDPDDKGRWDAFWHGLVTNLPTQVISVVLAAYIAYMISQRTPPEGVKYLLALFA